MGQLDNIFSDANLKDYSKACLALAMDIPKVFKKEELDTLIIPSRGAVPFFLGMAHGIQKIAEEGGLCPYAEDFYNHVGVQESLLPLLPKDSGIRKGSLEDKTYRVLLAPFTADLNLGKFDENEDTDEYIAKTRNYWANVTAAMFLPEKDRIKDPYFRSFTDVVLRHIEKRDDIAKLYEKFPKINRFGIMDTVISGRASNDILKSFEALAKNTPNKNLNPYAFLIIDRNGEQLRKDFERYLRDRKNSEMATFYPIPRIVSEDENASLLGVGAVVYPSVMKASKEMLTLNKKEFFIGAGSWRLDEDLGPKKDNPHIDNFNQFMKMIYSGIDLELFGGEEQKNTFNANRDRFLDMAYKSNILGHAAFNLKYITKELRYKPTTPYETGSFVLHLPFDSRATRKIVSELGSMDGVSTGTGTGSFKLSEIPRYKPQS